MEQDEHHLEEGEIEDEDDVINAYIPLKRPETYALDIPQKRFPAVDTHYSDSEQELQSSDTDSDSDAGLPKNKKPKKFKVVPKPLKQKSENLKKYDIWSSRAQEDVLAETMVTCDVSLKDRSRESETYDFSLARKYHEELENRQGNKRSREDIKNINFRPRKRSAFDDEEYKGKPRIIGDLSVDESSSDADIVNDLVNKLNEERDDLVLKVLETIGRKRTFEIFKETQRIEMEGGMPIMNQTRRRTAGGVFFYLVRNDYHITPAQRQNIFSEDKQTIKKMAKERRKKKYQSLKNATNIERSKILPELLTRAELFSKEGLVRKLKETDEANCTNPPPSPETDHHESGDGMDPAPTVESHPLPDKLSLTSNNVNDKVAIRETLKTYDDDFLDINCDNDMDLF